jgi:hypothetical protein
MRRARFLAFLTVAARCEFSGSHYLARTRQVAQPVHFVRLRLRLHTRLLPGSQEVRIRRLSSTHQTSAARGRTGAAGSIGVGPRVDPRGSERRRRAGGDSNRRCNSYLDGNHSKPRYETSRVGGRIKSGVGKTRSRAPRPQTGRHRVLRRGCWRLSKESVCAAVV